MATSTLCLLIALSSFSAAPRDIPTEICDNVVLTPEQLREATAMAKKAYPGEIERIYMGQLAHPLSWMGVRFHFKPDILGTYVIQRRVTVQFESEEREVPSPKTVAESRERVPVGEFKLLPLDTDVYRLFRLKSATLHLILPDEISYSQALSLLKAIEMRDYTSHEDIQSGDPSIDVSKIFTLRYERETGRIEVRTSERRFEGKSAVFVVRPNGFELVRFGRWVM
jgi:hypothetical protein